MEAGERRVLWLMATPFLAGVAVLVAAPALGSVWLSFSEWDLIRAPRAVGLGNYRELVSDPLFRISVRNSLLLLATAVPLRLLGALGLALLFHRRDRFAGVGRVAAVVPTVIPDAAYALVWLWLLNPVYGPVNLAFGALGLPTPSWWSEPGSARWGIVLMSLFQLGEGFLIALVARGQVPQELIELATIDGAGRWGRFVRVLLPIMAPALLLIAMRDTILTLQATFVPALLVTDGGPPPFATTTLPLFAFRNAFEYLRYGYASAAVVLMLVLTASIVWLEYRLVARWTTRLAS